MSAAARGQLADGARGRLGNAAYLRVLRHGCEMTVQTVTTPQPSVNRGAWDALRQARVRRRGPPAPRPTLELRKAVTTPVVYMKCSI